MKIINAKTKLVKVPSKYLFLNSGSFKSFVLAHVFTVIIIAIAGKLSKHAKMNVNILSITPIIEPISNIPISFDCGYISLNNLLIIIEQGIINIRHVNMVLSTT